MHLAALDHIESELDARSPAEVNAIVQLISSPIANAPLINGKLTYLMNKGMTLMGLLGRKGEEADQGNLMRRGRCGVQCTVLGNSWTRCGSVLSHRKALRRRF